MSEQHHPAVEADSSRPTGRRRLLQALALGGVSAAVLPEKWVKPVIDTVIVPAHAQATIVSITGIYSNNLQQGMMVPGGIFERLANFVIPSAHAQQSLATFPSQCVSFDCSDNPDVVVRYWDSTRVDSYSNAIVQISQDNRIGDVEIGGYNFTNLVATNTLLLGRVTNVSNTIHSESFQLGPGGECIPT
ncbi:hypothetical protein [Pseudazoarcus pumilus]|uniref:Uncharacterized protein n=1 Tax=Pseudazoarcus pumilus TaxID=2067960 RepID=A0A2I6S3A5_9RHOO|nr:hypothetical protein [Pseudazoarcus pumilus]AUN93725.1 hypothetical protein C0099_01505 [Pseudazoarcus pumilus]